MKKSYIKPTVFVEHLAMKSSISTCDCVSTAKIEDNYFCNNQVYNPGTYSSDIVLDNGKVTVEVTVSKTKIKSVELKESTEEIPVFYPLFESAADNIGNYVVKEQELSYVPDEYSSVTSGLVLDAVERSLEQAKVN